jgi:hypothetical protein
MEKTNTSITSVSTKPAPEPRRIRKFRLELVKLIPRIPNDQQSLQKMQHESLHGVLIHYIHWRARYVGVRPRQIEVEPIAKADPRWSANAAAVEALRQKIERGDDLTPHLSLAPHTRGYSLAANTPGATNEDRWSDKDLLLTMMGYHHFHLGTSFEVAGHVTRTNELIFAQVGRDEFKVIAIFDHDVFNDDSHERRRLKALHDSIVFRELPPGAWVMSAPVMSSGHAMHVVMYAQSCARIIDFVDPQLDHRAYVENMYVTSKVARPAKSKFKWIFLHLDLAVYDSATGVAFLMEQGWN